MTDELHEMPIGEPEIKELIAAFYQRVRDDDLIGPMYPNSDWQGAEQRLRDFLIFRFGGSDQYIKDRGHPRLRMRHAPFRIGNAERDRWMQIMRQAIEEMNFPENVVQTLTAFFQQVADFMRNVQE